MTSKMGTNPGNGRQIRVRAKSAVNLIYVDGSKGSKEMSIAVGPSTLTSRSPGLRRSRTTATSPLRRRSSVRPGSNLKEIVYPETPLVYIRVPSKSNAYRDWIQGLGARIPSSTEPRRKSKSCYFRPKNTNSGGKLVKSVSTNFESTPEVRNSPEDRRRSMAKLSRVKSLFDMWLSEGQRPGGLSKFDSMAHALYQMSKKSAESILHRPIDDGGDLKSYPGGFHGFRVKVMEILHLGCQRKFIPEIDFRAIWQLFRFYFAEQDYDSNKRSSRSRKVLEAPSSSLALLDNASTDTEEDAKLVQLLRDTMNETSLGNPVFAFLLIYGIFLKMRDDLDNDLLGPILGRSFFNLPIQIFYTRFLEIFNTSLAECNGNGSSTSASTSSSSVTSSSRSSHLSVLVSSRSRTCSDSSAPGKSQAQLPKTSSRHKRSMCMLSKPKLSSSREVTVCTVPRNLTKDKTIHLEGCRYDVVRRIALECGFRVVGDPEGARVNWSDCPLTLDRCLALQRSFQFNSIGSPLPKLNHFLGINEICRKDLLANNLNRMRVSHPEEYAFFPRTWALPEGWGSLSEYAAARENRCTFICKPEAGSQGKGIFLLRNLKKLPQTSRMICQVYLRPYLIDDLKFDLRIFSLVTCVDPLRIFLYDEGIARFATVKYADPTDENIEVTYMHLTNYSLNRFSTGFVPGSKRKLSQVLEVMASRGEDVASLKDGIDDLVVKTIIAAAPALRTHYRSAWPRKREEIGGCACFEILGFDILLNHHLKPYLLEVNHSPSFNLDLEVDAEVKEGLLRDTFNILYLVDGPSDSEVAPSRTPGASQTLKAQFRYEEEHCGGFRLIYGGGSQEKGGKFSHLLEKSAKNVRNVQALPRSRSIHYGARTSSSIMNPQSFRRPSLTPATLHGYSTIPPRAVTVSSNLLGRSRTFVSTTRSCRVVQKESPIMACRGRSVSSREDCRRSRSSDKKPGKLLKKKKNTPRVSRKLPKGSTSILGGKESPDSSKSSLGSGGVEEDAQKSRQKTKKRITRQVLTILAAKQREGDEARARKSCREVREVNDEGGARESLVVGGSSAGMQSKYSQSRFRTLQSNSSRSRRLDLERPIYTETQKPKWK